MKPGDVVQLQVGGPAMVVNHVNEQVNITCVWFDKEDHLQAGTFYRDVLKPYGQK